VHFSLHDHQFGPVPHAHPWNLHVTVHCVNSAIRLCCSAHSL